MADSPGTYRIWGVQRGDWCDREVISTAAHVRDIERLFPQSWNRDGEELRRDVALVLEPGHDEPSVSIRCDGRIIGRLPPDETQRWSPVLRRIAASGLTAVTVGRIHLHEHTVWSDRDDWDVPPRRATSARIHVKLTEDPSLALPLNDPPGQPYTMLPRSAIVQVTKESDHFDSLFEFVPAGGYGLLYATLHRSRQATSRSSPVVDVHIDGRKIGQLTPQMSRRFLPMIDHLDRRGLVTACWGDIRGSAVAAKVRIDAVKANEANDDILDGPPITIPALIPEYAARPHSDPTDDWNPESPVRPSTHRGHSTGASLRKGGNVSLSTRAGDLTVVAVELGWEVREKTSSNHELDASALLTGPDLRVLSDRHFIFYNNLRSPDGAVWHNGNAAVSGPQRIDINLVALSPAVTNIFFPVSIHDAAARRQSFGQITGASIRVVDHDTGRELTRYDLADDASTETAMVFGELYRHGDGWRFRAVGQGYASGLAGIARDYGVDV